MFSFVPSLRLCTISSKTTERWGISYQSPFEKNSFFGQTIWIWKLWKEKEKTGEKIQYPKNKKSFLEEREIIFHNFLNAFFW